MTPIGKAIYFSGVAVIAAALLDIVLQFLIRVAFRRRVVAIEIPVLFLSIGAGAAALWMASAIAGAPLIRALSSAALYFFFAIMYLQCKSVFSRGYSIRIMVDLLSRPHGTTMAQMKNNYGEGKGLAGMLEKRFESMADFGFLVKENASVGPLTPLGRILARTGAVYRRLLRLDVVG